MSSDKKKVVEIKKNDKLRKALISCAVVIILVVVGLTAVLAGGDFGSNNIRRMFSYLTVSRNSDGLAEQYAYSEHSKNSFASYNYGLAVASVSGLSYYDKNGNEALTVSLLQKTPAITSGKAAAAVYDIGGTDIVMFNSGGTLMQTITDKSILAVKINNAGFLAVVTGESGAKALVTVYNSSGERAFQYHSSSSYITSAAVSQDNVYMSCLAIGQTESRYESRLITYRLDSDEEYSNCSLGDKVVLDIGYFNDGTLFAVTDSSIIMTDGFSVLSAYEYSGRYLRDFSIAPEGYAVIALNKYKAGSRCTVVTIDSSSNVIGTLEYSDEILSISASGGYIAVLTNSYLTIYNSDLSICSKLNDTGTAKSVIIRDDGTALLIGGSAAKIYIP